MLQLTLIHTVHIPSEIVGVFKHTYIHTYTEKDYLEAEAEQDAIDNQKRDDDWGDEMVPVPVDESILSQLLDMGFSDIRGRKSIVHGKNLEGPFTASNIHTYIHHLWAGVFGNRSSGVAQ